LKTVRMTNNQVM